MSTRSRTPTPKRKILSDASAKKTVSAKKQKTADIADEMEVEETPVPVSGKKTRRNSNSNSAIVEEPTRSKKLSSSSTTKTLINENIFVLDPHHNSELDENASLGWKHDGNRIEKRSPVNSVASTGTRGRGRADATPAVSSQTRPTSTARTGVSDGRVLQELQPLSTPPTSTNRNPAPNSSSSRPQGHAASGTSTISSRAAPTGTAASRSITGASLNVIDSVAHAASSSTSVAYRSEVLPSTPASVSISQAAPVTFGSAAVNSCAEPAAANATSETSTLLIAQLRTLAGDGAEALSALAEAYGECVESLDTKSKWMLFGAIGVAGYLSGLYISMNWQSRAQLQLGANMIAVLEDIDRNTNTMSAQVTSLMKF